MIYRTNPFRDPIRFITHDLRIYFSNLGRAILGKDPSLNCCDIYSFYDYILDKLSEGVGGIIENKGSYPARFNSIEEYIEELKEFKSVCDRVKACDYDNNWEEEEKDRERFLEIFKSHFFSLWI